MKCMVYALNGCNVSFIAVFKHSKFLLNMWSVGSFSFGWWVNIVLEGFLSNFSSVSGSGIFVKI